MIVRAAFRVRYHTIPCSCAHTFPSLDHTRTKFGKGFDSAENRLLYYAGYVKTTIMLPTRPPDTYQFLDNKRQPAYRHLLICLGNNL